MKTHVITFYNICTPESKMASTEGVMSQDICKLLRISGLDFAFMSVSKAEKSLNPGGTGRTLYKRDEQKSMSMHAFSPHHHSTAIHRHKNKKNKKNDLLWCNGNVHKQVNSCYHVT